MPNTPPSLDSLAGEWMPSHDVAHPPSTTNSWGGTGTSKNALGVKNLAVAPYLDAGDDWCALAVDGVPVDGVPVPADAYRWSAYEVTRRATTPAGVDVLTSTRLAFDRSTGVTPG
jgi:hypothetical protein